MANISSYPNKTPKLGDIIIFSETYDVNAASPVVGNPTKSTSVSGIGAAISPTIAIGTINTVPMFTTVNKIGDSPIVFDGSTLYTVGSVVSKDYKLKALNTAPNSSTDTGVLGEIRYTSDAVYVCIATNTWRKSELLNF